MDLAALRTEFVARGFDRLDVSGNTRKDAYLNRAVHRIAERELWPFLEVTQTGTSPITPSSTLRTVLSIVDTTNDAPLEPVDYHELRIDDPDLSATGTAWGWYMDTPTSLKAYPTNTSATYSVRYIRVHPDLAAGTEPLIPVRYQYAIVDGACAMAYRDRGNLELADACDQAVENVILEMTNSLLVQSVDARSTYVTGASTDW